MVRVVSFGSVNVDRTWTVDAETLRVLREEEWFPNPGETRTIDDVPSLPNVGAPTVSLGGKGANDAVAAAGVGADARMVGAVGADASEYDVLTTLAERGVDTSAVRVEDDVPTGSAYIFVEPDGESHVARLRGANAEVDAALAEDALDVVADADALCLQNEVPVDAMTALLDALEERAVGDEDGPVVVLDPAPAEGAEAVARHPRVDYLTPNEVEYDQLADVLADQDATVVVTRGADDVVVRRRGEERFRVTPPAADVEDTTGAGDTFAGALATRLGEGANARDAVEFAASASAVATEAVGAQTAMPSRSAVEDRL